MWRQLIKSRKKYERTLAPLVFPMLERDKRKKQGMHYTEVSTPQTTTEIDSLYESKIDKKITSKKHS